MNSDKLKNKNNDSFKSRKILKELCENIPEVANAIKSHNIFLTLKNL